MPGCHQTEATSYLSSHFWYKIVSTAACDCVPTVSLTMGPDHTPVLHCHSIIF